MQKITEKNLRGPCACKNKEKIKLQNSKKTQKIKENDKRKERNQNFKLFSIKIVVTIYAKKKVGEIS